MFHKKAYTHNSQGDRVPALLPELLQELLQELSDTSKSRTLIQIDFKGHTERPRGKKWETPRS